MVKLFCAVIGVAGSAFPVTIDESETVGDLKKSIKEEKKNDWEKVDATSLQLFLAMKNGAWLRDSDTAAEELLKGKAHIAIDRVEMTSTWTIEDTLKDNKLPDPQSRQIHVLVQLPSQAWSNWELDDAHCPAFVIDESPLVRIASAYTLGSGLAVNEGRDLLLYRRAQLIEEWQAIQTYVCATYAELWIVGPPGTGKSCAAFAFACSLDRTDWDVVWIHCPKKGYGPLQCILFCGASDKWTCKIYPEDLLSLLKALQDRTVVFVDGYAKTNGKGHTIRDACVRWREDLKTYHRLVWVSSMVSLGKEYYPTQYKIIPTAVNAAALKSLAAFDKWVPREKVKEEELFELMSWTMEDYETVMMNDEFFEHVKGKFTDTNGPVTWEERKPLLEDKFFVVGGSARYMFENRVEDAIVELDKAIDATDNIKDYVVGTRGISSDGAVNRLFSWYRVGGHAQSSLLSKHVARRLAQILGPDFVQNISNALTMNPSLDGHLFELWFFAKLTHGGVECYGIGQNEERVVRDVWGSEIVPYFSSNDTIPLNKAKQWLAPRKWNQGGYDAVFVETLNDLGGAQAVKVRVRFVQVTRADKHSFKEQFFVTLLTKLRLTLPNCQFEAVEVSFAVPIRKLASYETKVSEKQVQKDVLEPAGLSVEATRVAIDVVGLQYKEFRASDDPERLEV